MNTEMTLHDEERLASSLAKLWKVAAEKEERIKMIFNCGVQNAEDAETVQMLCMLVVGELCYERKEWK